MLTQNCIHALAFATNLSQIDRHSNPYTLCKLLDIEIIDDKVLHQDGYLVCCEGHKLIFISSRITNRHRQKFIVAHELGHFLMHRTGLFCCEKISDFGSIKVNTTSQENEANAFASELLLPTDKLIEHLPCSPIGFSTVTDIASMFDVSVTHAAMKAVQMSNSENETLLCYDGRRLKWYVTSNRSIFYSRIPKYCPIDLPSAEKQSDIIGAWDDLYHGSVHQEIFHTYANQNLVLLSQQ